VRKSDGGATRRIWPWPGDQAEQLRVCLWSCRSAGERGWLATYRKVSVENHFWVGKWVGKHSSIPSLPQQTSTPSAGANEPGPPNAAADFWSCAAIATFPFRVSRVFLFHSLFTLASLQVAWWFDQEIMANLHLAGCQIDLLAV